MIYKALDDLYDRQGMLAQECLSSENRWRGVPGGSRWVILLLESAALCESGSTAGVFKMTNWRNKKMLIVCLIASVATFAHSEPTMEKSRGELLYSTHCVACHTTNVHWRDKGEVTDWKSLNGQVRKWQESIGLGWSADDVAAVSSYLNAVHYHLPAAKPKEVALQKREN